MVIKYLLGLFGHCTLWILDRRAFCQKPHYSDSEQEENQTDRSDVGFERKLHSGEPTPEQLAIDLAEHDVLRACQEEMDLC